MPRRIKAVLKEKGVQPGTSKVYLIKWPVSLYVLLSKYFIWKPIYILENNHALENHNYDIKSQSKIKK